PQWETEQAARWCDELGIFLGADADDLADTYIPRDNYHWDQGLRRLALGVFMGAAPEDEPRFYRAPDSNEYLPYATTQDEISAVAAFIAKARSLIYDATRIRSQRLTLSRWSALLIDLIAGYIEIDSPADQHVRDQCIEAIESIAGAEFRSEPVSYRIAHELISARLAALDSQLVRFSEHGIAVGPLSALRSIPMRAIFLLGLNEGGFPERERRDPMDLRVARIAGDVSATERDRYLFLETLMAARESICLSWPAREAKTGDRLEPASTVRELQFILHDYVADDALVQMTIEYPLSRYDTDYLPELRRSESIVNRNIVTYDSAARQSAIMSALRSDASAHCEHLPLPGRDDTIYPMLSQSAQSVLRPALRLPSPAPRAQREQPIASAIRLPAGALRRFLECPIQGAAQYALGIFEDEEDAELAQDEPLAATVLNRTNLMREVFLKSRSNSQSIENEYSTALRIARLSGHAPAGPFADAAQRADRIAMANWIEQARRAGCDNLERWREIRMGRGDDSAQLVVEELILPICDPTRTGPPREWPARIFGSLGLIAPSGDASLRLVLRDAPKVKDFLGSFVSALILASAEQIPATSFRAIVVGSGKKKCWNQARVLRVPTAADAGRYLSELAGDLLFGKNHYFLPIESVEDIYKEIVRGGTDDFVDIVNEQREDEFARCSSDYGPIRDARRFAPPAGDALKAIMRRRFDLIGAVFERPKD
ncbi:MAG TPA: hypothetical protein VMT64_05485, partial [Candidatus Binataceae bacterium]|nr:hypothetical protein [Candidatus Binataceae bacterium]